MLKMLSVMSLKPWTLQEGRHIRQVTAYIDQVREATDQMEELFLNVIEIPNHETAWESKVFINNKKVSIKLDRSADITVLSEKFCESKYHTWPILPTNKVLIGPCKIKFLVWAK